MPPSRQHGGCLPPRYEAVLPLAQARAVAALSIRDLADYVGWLHERNWPHEHRPAYRLAEGFFPLLATGRRAGRKPGRIAGQPEAVGAGAGGPLAGPGQPPFRDAEAGRPLLAARPGPAGAAVRHRLPGLGAVEPEACTTCTSTKAIASAAAKATRSGWCRWAPRPPRRCGRISSTNAARWRRRFRRRRDGSCSPIAAAACGASGSGNS